MSMQLDLAGKMVLVTGASKGIGFSIAEEFAREGARVVICARSAGNLEEAVARIRQSTGQGVDARVADVTRIGEIDALVRHIDEKYGRLDVLVNNAGTGTYKPFLEVTDEELVNGMALNFFAQFRVTQRAVPLLRKGAGASIINISGRSGVRGTFPPGSSCTGPAKAAEIRFSIDLAAELAQDSIRVNCLVPGIVETPDRFKLWESTVMKADLDDAATEQLRRNVEKVSMGSGRKWGQPIEIANLVLFLASERSAYVNGTAITVDGGSFNTSYVSELHARRQGGQT